MKCDCNLGSCGDAFAVWLPRWNDAQLSLCKKCLDYWLDNADDDPDLEPKEIRWTGRQPAGTPSAGPGRS